MTLLHIDGFDDRATSFSSFLISKPGISLNIGAGQIFSGVGRLGTNAATCNNNNVGFRWEASDNPEVSHTDPVIYFGMGIRPLTASGGVDGFVYLYHAGEALNHLTLVLEADSTISVRRGNHAGTEIGRTSVISMPIGTYHYFEFKFTINDTTGTIDIWRDGVNIFTDTGLDTKNGGTASFIDRLDFQGASGFTYYLDDLYIGNTQGSDLVDAIKADLHVETLFPSAEGVTIQHTPSTGTDNSALIDETPGHNTDTDYNEDGTPGNIDEFDYDNMTDNTVTIHAIQMMSVARKTDAGAISLRNRIDSGASIGTGADMSLATAYELFTDIFENDPQGGGAWTGARVEAAEYGYETRT